MIATEFIHRDELIEHVIVYHQQHRWVGRVALQTEESLAGIISLHIMHVGRCDELLILLAIRRKGNAAVEEYLQVWPYLFQMFLARYFHHTHQHAEHPTRHARYVGHVLVQGLMCDAVALHLEIAQQGGFLLRHTYHVDQWIDILDEDGTQVAYQTIRQIVVGRMAATQNETLAIKKPALGVVAQIESYRIATTGIVDVMQSIV